MTLHSGPSAPSTPDDVRPPMPDAGVGRGELPAAGAEPRGIDLSRCVPALLTGLANKLSSSSSTIYRQRFGIGFVEWRVICHLAVEDWSTGARVSQMVGLDKAAVSRSMTVLLERGLIRMRPGTGRRTEASLTEEGRHLKDEILSVAHAREDRLLAGLSPDELENLIRSLRLLTRNVALMDEEPGSA